MTGPRVPVVSAATDFCNWCAGEILRRHREQAPDLSRVTLLLPAWGGAATLRRELVRQHGGPLLGPDIRLLHDFADSRASDGPALSPLECRLMLGVALRRNPGLVPQGGDASRVADALFTLFEELTANAVKVPATEQAFADALQSAYGCGANSWLSSEAQLVFRLWQAFLEDSGGRSPAAVYRARLANALASAGANERIYLLGFDEFSTAERAALAPALAGGRVELWLQGRSEGHDGRWITPLLESLGAEAEPTGNEGPRTALLDQAFADAPRAIEATEPGISIVEAASAESEARCVELAVREAVLAGDRDVVVLTQDRRLARRLRALLERAGLPLNDPVGWALSTSSAAALVDAWFECIEQRFHFRPLLEVLKSGFVPASDSALAFLERDLVFKRKLERGLDRLQEAAAPHEGLRRLLEQVQEASRAFQRSDRPRKAHLWTGELLSVLRLLKAESRLRTDPAGQKLLALIEQLQAAFRRQSVALDYSGFRDLLTRTIEAETFVPDLTPGPVRLITLEQSHNLRCDTLIVAGASRDLLPGGVPAQPFFNQSVRSELGLPGWPARVALGTARFRRVLEAADRVVVTYSSESVHDAPQPSPWIEALDAQAQRCGITLRNARLTQLCGTAEVEVAGESDPPDRTQRPSPIIAGDRLPTELSASAHQRLIDCPYKFQAQDVLKLRAPEAPDEDLRRKDYGDHVHRILCAFTQRLDDLPPPFDEPVNAANRHRAQQRLEEIAEAVFAPERQRRALVLSWEAEFHAAIPGILDWLEERGDIVEVHAEVELKEGLGQVTLTGKLDRLEVLRDGSKVVVDYKTGRVDKKAAVEAGESVQLLHYAGLDPRIAAAEFVALKDKETSVRLDEGLAELRGQAERRLRNTLDAIRNGSGLPANGDEKSCEYCDYQGLCRKGDWSDD